MNTCEKTSQDEKNKMVEEYIDRLKVSGYSKKQVREVITSGLTGYTSKVRRAELEKRPLHRPAQSTLVHRQKKKLLEKTSWYKPRKDKKLEDRIQLPEGKVKKKMHKKDHTNFEVRAVLFVPRTKGGVLATRLREAEEKLAEITGYKVKVVERGGKMIVRCLHKANPWDGQDCDREDCLLCASQVGGEDTKQSCKKRNIVYATICQECHHEGKVVKYVGESSRSAYERGREHVNDYRNLSLDSHMLKHNILYHPEKEQVDFKMRILEAHKNAFSRQIHEAVAIEMASTGGIIMNSKSEYNRCALPRLTIDGKTSTGVGGAGGEASQVYLTDEELEAKIVQLRKQRRIRQRQEERVEDNENMWKTGVMQGGPRKKFKLDNEIHKKRGRWRRADPSVVSKHKKRRLAPEKDQSSDEVVCDNFEVVVGKRPVSHSPRRAVVEIAPEVALSAIHSVRVGEKCTPAKVVTDQPSQSGTFGNEIFVKASLNEMSATKVVRKVAPVAAMSGGQSVKEIRNKLEAKFGSRCQKKTSEQPKPVKTSKMEIQIQPPKTTLKKNSIKKLENAGKTKSILNYFEPSKPITKKSPAKNQQKILSLKKKKLGFTTNSSRTPKPKNKPKPTLSPQVQKVIKDYFMGTNSTRHKANLEGS